MCFLKKNSVLYSLFEVFLLLNFVSIITFLFRNISYSIVLYESLHLNHFKSQIFDLLLHDFSKSDLKYNAIMGKYSLAPKSNSQTVKLAVTLTVSLLTNFFLKHLCHIML